MKELTEANRSERSHERHAASSGHSRPGRLRSAGLGDAGRSRCCLQWTEAGHGDGRWARAERGHDLPVPVHLGDAAPSTHPQVSSDSVVPGGRQDGRESHWVPGPSTPLGQQGQLALPPVVPSTATW